VVCERCGQPHPDHPAAKSWENLPPPRRTRPVTVLPADYAATVYERVSALEKLVADLRTKVAVLEHQGSLKASKRPDKAA